MKEKEVIKTFLEWFKKKGWMNGSSPMSWYSFGIGEDVDTDQLIDLYEQETRMYTVGEVWDSVDSLYQGLYWKEWSIGNQQKLTVFAERYHELKTQNRIK